MARCAVIFKNENGKGKNLLHGKVWKIIGFASIYLSVFLKNEYGFWVIFLYYRCLDLCFVEALWLYLK